MVQASKLFGGLRAPLGTNFFLVPLGIKENQTGRGLIFPNKFPKREANGGGPKKVWAGKGGRP